MPLDRWDFLTPSQRESSPSSQWDFESTQAFKGNFSFSFLCQTTGFEKLQDIMLSYFQEQRHGRFPLSSKDILTTSSLLE